MQTHERLIRKIPSHSEMDTVKVRQKTIGKATDLQMVQTCRDLWENFEPFRRQRERAFRFTYVDQLSDMMEVNGKKMTMRKYLTSTGNVALQTNQMKNKVERMEGVIIKQSLEPLCVARDPKEQDLGTVLTEAVKANCKKNKVNKLYMSWTKEACLGGLMIGYESWDSVSGPSNKLDSWTSYVNPNMFFMDANMDDPRFWDMNIVGRIKRYDFGKLCANFAHNESDYALLAQIYPEQSQVFRHVNMMNMGDRFNDKLTDFMSDPDPAICCVCEVWTKESKPCIRLHDYNTATEEIIDANDYAYRKKVKAINEMRKRLAIAAGFSKDEVPYITGDGYGNDDEKNGFFVDEYWYCRDLAPDGTILWEGESPYPDRMHPFSVAAIPMIDGKIVGYHYEMIDHNIIMNRAVALNDWLIRTNAKGVTVVPKQIVPKDMSFQDFANSWTSIDDLVFIDVKPGMENLMPKTFFSQAQTFDVSKYLDTFSRMADKSTSNTEALQGVSPFSGASGSLYAQMENSSATGIAPFVETVDSFIEDVQLKKLKNIAQYYSPDRLEKIAGKLNIDVASLNLNDVGDIEYDFSVQESTETPMYIAAQNQEAKDLLINKFIGIDTYVDIIDTPYKETLRQGITREKEAAQAMQAAQQEQMAAAQQGQMQPQPQG